MVYLNINKDFFDKNKESMNKEAIEEMGDEGKDSYLFNDNEDGVIEEIDEEASTINIKCETSQLGYISMDIKVDSEDLLSLIELAVKKLNKFKTVLEGLK